VRHLEAHKVGTRQVFAGNIVRQPAYRGVPHRVVGALANSDFVMNSAFWVGVHPGITEDGLEYMLDVFHRLARRG
jgi:CDP-6-deoxy-D-xylo-4-hexulose-3-dehydrase